jgi:hypothetical protein
VPCRCRCLPLLVTPCLLFLRQRDLPSIPSTNRSDMLPCASSLDPPRASLHQTRNSNRSFCGRFEMSHQRRSNNAKIITNVEREKTKLGGDHDHPRSSPYRYKARSLIFIGFEVSPSLIADDRGDRQPELARRKSGETSDKDHHLCSDKQATSQSPSQPTILFLPYRPVVRSASSPPCQHVIRSCDGLQWPNTKARGSVCRARETLTP